MQPSSETAKYIFFFLETNWWAVEIKPLSEGTRSWYAFLLGCWRFRLDSKTPFSSDKSTYLFSYLQITNKVLIWPIWKPLPRVLEVFLTQSGVVSFSFGIFFLPWRQHCLPSIYILMFSRHTSTRRGSKAVEPGGGGRGFHMSRMYFRKQLI
jgi:hypothetical protein